jgi:hypothetical protein
LLSLPYGLGILFKATTSRDIISVIESAETGMATAVTRDQFEVRQNEVIHKPTGATFGAHPNDARVRDIDSGLAGKELANGSCYSLADIERVAAQLLAERLHSLE